MKRGDIVVCALSGDYGKPRPAVVVQSDFFSAHGSIAICPITSHLIETPLFRLPIKPNIKNGLSKLSQIMVDKITAVPREKIQKKIGDLSHELLADLNHALKLWLDIQ